MPSSSTMGKDPSPGIYQPHDDQTADTVTDPYTLELHSNHGPPPTGTLGSTTNGQRGSRSTMDSNNGATDPTDKGVLKSLPPHLRPPPPKVLPAPSSATVKANEAIKTLMSRVPPHLCGLVPPTKSRSQPPESGESKSKVEEDKPSKTTEAKSTGLDTAQARHDEEEAMAKHRANGNTTEPESAQAESAPDAGNVQDEMKVAQEIPTVETSDNNDNASVRLSSEAACKTILFHFQAIEATGLLAAENLASLQQLRDDILARVAPNTELKSLPTSTYDHRASPIEHTSTSQPYVPNLSTESEKQLSRTPDSAPNTVDDIRASTQPTDDVIPNDAKPAADTSNEVDENREEKVFFKDWGRLQQRTAPSAKVRTVIITDLPDAASPSFVASIVYGGPIEDLSINTSPSGRISARVRFVNAEDCKSYYDQTSNGLVYGKNNRKEELVVFVQLAKDVEVVGGLLGSWIEQDVSRCVRAIGVEKDWKIDSLKKRAEEKDRRLEGISDTINPAGSRVIIWRFCRIADAVTFKAVLVRDVDFEIANVQFTKDPCATARGVHFE